MDNLMELILEQEKSDVIDNLIDVYKRFIDFAKDNGIVSYKDKDAKEITIEEEEKKLSELANPDDLISALNDFVSGLDKDDNLKDSTKKYNDAKEKYDKVVVKTNESLKNIEESIIMMRGTNWLSSYFSDCDAQDMVLIKFYKDKYGLKENKEGLDCLKDFVLQLENLKDDPNIDPKIKTGDLENLRIYIDLYPKFSEEPKYDIKENIRANINLSYDELLEKVKQHNKAIESSQKIIAYIKNNAGQSGLSDEQIKNIEKEEKQIANSNKQIDIYYGIYLLKKLKEDNIFTEQDFAYKISLFKISDGKDKLKGDKSLEKYLQIDKYLRARQEWLAEELEKANKALIDTANNDELKQAKKELEETENSELVQEYSELREQKKKTSQDYDNNKDYLSAYNLILSFLLNAKEEEINVNNITEKINDFIEKIKNSRSDSKALEEVEKTIVKYDPSKRNVNVDKLRKLAEHKDIDKIKKNLENEYLSVKTKSKVKFKGINKKAVLKAVAGIAGGVVGFGLAVNPVTGAIINPTVTTAITLMSMGKTAWNVVKFVDRKLHKDTDEKDLATTKFINKISAPLKKLGDKIIPKGLKDGLDKVNKALKNEYVQATFNGMAAGYSIGKIYKFGKNIFEARSAATETKPQTFKSPTTQEDYNLNRNTTLEPGSSVGNLAQVPRDTGILDFVKGQTYDLSEIAKGYVASGQASDKAINLITAAGKNVSFDRTVIKDGVEWCHFLQENGKGYAWFPKEVVEEVLKAKGLH